MKTKNKKYYTMMEDDPKYEDEERSATSRPTTLYIAPNCGLKLELNKENIKEFGLEYKVLNIKEFPNINDYNQQETTGWLSPMHAVTLPPEAKTKAGIPVNATAYSYVYPPPGLADNINWDQVSPTSDDTNHISDLTQSNKWALPYVATFGAYAYFDEDEELLVVNAISFNETPYALNFAGPFVAAKDSYREVNDLYRYQSLCLDSFVELGFIGLAWINPEENEFIDTEVQGQSQSCVQNHHGGILYFRRDKTAVLFLVESAKFPMNTPSHGVEAPIIDAFRVVKHELQTKSLSTTFPTAEEKVMEIHRACEEGSTGHVEYLISKNKFMDTNVLSVQDSLGWTPLHYACYFHANNDELIEMLINANSDLGAFIEINSEDGQINAKSDGASIEINSKAGQICLAKSKNNLYPIHLACQNGHQSLKAVELLMKYDRNHSTINAKSKHHGFLPLHFACSNSQTPLEVIRTLILHDEGIIHEKSRFGSTPLYLAIASNHSHQVIDILLNSGSETEKTNPMLLEKVNGMLPIHLACLRGCSVDIVSLLLKADVEDKCFYSIVEECKEYDLINSTILHIALAHSPVDVIKLLIAKEVTERFKPSKKTENLFSVKDGHSGMNPIHVACARKDLGVDIIRQLLLLERESISYVDSAGNTPLHHVCNNENADENLVELLLKTEDTYFLKQGKSGQLDQLSVKKSNKDDKTPLHLAVKAKATGTHALLQPKYMCLKGLEGEGKDKLVELVLASKKDDGSLDPINKKVQNSVVANLAERQYFVPIFLELVANIFATIIYINVSIATVNGVRAIRPVESVALITCSVIFILRELIQLRSVTLSRYISNGWNWIECASITALLTATVHLIQLRGSFRGSTYGEHGEYGEPETRLLFTWSGALLLLQFIFIVRTTFLPFARFVAGLLAILISLIPFLIVSVMLLIIFTYSYVISGRRTEECPDFVDCLFWTLEGFFYGMDGFAVDPVLDILFGLIAVVILLNVVIAIVSNAWDDSLHNTREVFWQSRVELLFQYRIFKGCLGSDSIFSPLFNLADSVDFFGNETKNKKVEGANSSLWKSWKSFATKIFWFASNILWFVLGLGTCGLLWPRELRIRILSAGM